MIALQLITGLLLAFSASAQKGEAFKVVDLWRVHADGCKVADEVVVNAAITQAIEDKLVAEDYTKYSPPPQLRRHERELSCTCHPNAPSGCAYYGDTFCHSVPYCSVMCWQWCSCSRRMEAEGENQENRQLWTAGDRELVSSSAVAAELRKSAIAAIGALTKSDLNAGCVAALETADVAVGLIKDSGKGNDIWAFTNGDTVSIPAGEIPVWSDYF